MLLVGCTTPPQSPSSPPQPQSPPPPPPQQTQPREQQTQTTQGGGAESQTPSQSPPSEQAEPQAPNQSDGGQTAPPPPSSESADVEIRDIPVDADGNPIEVPQRETAASPRGIEQTKPAAQSGGGGSAPPPSGANRAGAQPSGGTQQNGTPALTDTIDVRPITAQERGAALEADLQKRLSEFDEQMRKARQDAATRGAAGGGTSAGAGARPLPPPTSGAGGQADRSSGLGNTPDITGTTQPGEYRGAVGPTPSGLPDARDDDIVARQLREAASRESDPVLQEKLWEEYRKYRKGIGR